MPRLSTMTPFIYAGHYYLFPKERNAGERDRTGYCYAFHYIAEGRGVITIAGKPYPVRKGDFIRIPPLELHTFDTQEPHLFVTYNIYCDLWNPAPGKDNPLVTYHQVDPGQLVRMLPCPELDEMPVVLPLRHHPMLSEMFVRTYDLYAAGQSEGIKLAGLYLQALLLELSLLPKQTSFDPRIASLSERLEKGDPDLQVASVADWAADCGLRNTQFSTLFKRMTGMAPQAYKTRMKMRKAAAALIESTRSISDIAASHGYSTIHHFSRQFSAYYGVSPSAYRGRYIRKEMAPD
ncbi:AraC family transcriptional regulator [Paenibacillus nasutitermitis]|uniref:HTH araC/xylS-type domain-containing protein n=1 Tax=Paenibacillus nasutitermitis TaxID=1652958 RepID=A0A917E238_9BACL|nr:AraC family transcriptional regulator [Paenibacillus nasutitermitis]GGD97161.1 hypothetical protein GCM10010911_64870 [Paenibacillus nasutitermitis]